MTEFISVVGEMFIDTAINRPEQFALAITGVVAIRLTQSANPDVRKYACLFGLLGQPIWFYTTYQSEQWGIFFLCFFYTEAWLKGVKIHWWPLIKKKVFQWS